MAQSYVCPSCKTNRSRFHLIEQEVVAVKLDPQSGEVIQQYEQNRLDPFHLPYRGPTRRIQCGSCGLNEEERRFIRQS
ncbi:hypothetical protein [Halalkalibacterium ligniniphilum]|uniref:hypothetical protein n=1 Tax=Halalkalibacterium ligniniphilum TaxID=1134413 RepID=UPI00037A67C3|nr:hypothetical protein [Halalkalibacterium ligniniphilum]